MDQYTSVSYELARKLTLRYSTSFGMSSRLFDKSIRLHIYAIYGLVRIADEIVDVYTGNDQIERLDSLERSVYDAITCGYSENPLVHAFALTAKKYAIEKDIIAPFFLSMRIDAGRPSYSTDMYESYIYGSAEVVGLMCLKVFAGGDNKQYKALEDGAKHLGSAYQKINFLRDFAHDYTSLGRVYFPGVSYKTFSNPEKLEIILDVDADLAIAEKALKNLPRIAKPAVHASYLYYACLLDKLRKADVKEIKNSRIRISNFTKIVLLLKAYIVKAQI